MKLWKIAVDGTVVYSKVQAEHVDALVDDMEHEHGPLHGMWWDDDTRTVHVTTEAAVDAAVAHEEWLAEGGHLD